MRDHPFHRRIGNLVSGLGLTHGKQIWLDKACGGEGLIPLYEATGSEGVPFCFVDILLLLEGRLVIIEIEESDVKPLHLLGKFYASAFSTHFNDQDISKLPLLFIQVLDTSRINLEEGQKSGQWDRVEAILKGQAEKWLGRKAQYRLLWGRQDDFGAGGKESEKLLNLVKEWTYGDMVWENDLVDSDTSCPTS